MTKTKAFNDFVIRFKHLIAKNPHYLFFSKNILSMKQKQLKLFSYAFVSTAKGHHEALKCLIADIEEQKTNINGL